MLGDAPAARLLAEQLVAPLEQRWAHVQAVAARAESVADEYGQLGKGLVSAAWLHDIGYAPGLVHTGLHPLDGARHLRGVGVDELVVSMVAHHSWAVVEAGLRGLADELVGEFPAPDPEIADALCYCDMTTGPTGVYVEVEDRLAEIKERYGQGHLVTRFITEASPLILGSVHRVEERLAAAQSR